MLVGRRTSFKKKMLQFSQKFVESKDFYKNKRITNTVNHDKIVVFKNIPCNEGKNQCYTVG